MHSRWRSSVIFHGCCESEEYADPMRPSPSNADWLPWMQKQLSLRDYVCQAPEMPAPYDPDYAAWKHVADSIDINEHSLLIAHSCGCGFVLRWLSETRQAVEHLLLVSPWLDLQNSRGSFLDFTPSPAIADAVGAIDIVYAADDPVAGVWETVELLRSTYPAAHIHRMADGGHLSGEDFPPERYHLLAGLLP